MHRRNCVRGRMVSLIPQDPMTALSPVHTIGRQLREAVELAGYDRAAAEQRSLELLEAVHIRQPAPTVAQIVKIGSGCRILAFFVEAWPGNVDRRLLECAVEDEHRRRIGVGAGGFERALHLKELGGLARPDVTGQKLQRLRCARSTNRRACGRLASRSSPRRGRGRWRRDRPRRWQRRRGTSRGSPGRRG